MRLIRSGKKRTTEEIANEQLNRQGYYTIEETNNLSKDEKIIILDNTIKKIISYYNEHDISRLTTLFQENFKPHQLNYNERTGTYSEDNKMKNFNNFFKHKYTNFFQMYINKKEKYYEEIYHYAIKFFNFRSRYIQEKEIYKKLYELSKIMELEQIIKPDMFEHINIGINFHQKIRENQLNQYFNYSYNADKKNELEINLILNSHYQLFFLLFRKRIKIVNIDTKIKNPYYL